jgi:hypothetical protein
VTRRLVRSLRQWLATLGVATSAWRIFGAENGGQKASAYRQRNAATRRSALLSAPPRRITACSRGVKAFGIAGRKSFKPNVGGGIKRWRHRWQRAIGNMLAAKSVLIAIAARWR